MRADHRTALSARSFTYIAKSRLVKVGARFSLKTSRSRAMPDLRRRKTPPAPFAVLESHHCTPPTLNCYAATLLLPSRNDSQRESKKIPLRHKKILFILFERAAGGGAEISGKIFSFFVRSFLRVTEMGNLLVTWQYGARRKYPRRRPRAGPGVSPLP